MADMLVSTLVLSMLRCPYEIDDTPQGARASNIANMLQFIDTHYTDVTLRDLSERFGYSQKYVSRLIKQVTGKTFKAYVAARRMERAVQLLENTQLSVREVAAECGLENMSHFYHQFFDAYGCTPREYAIQGESHNRQS